MITTSWLMGGAVLGSLTAGWTYVKIACGKVFHLFVQEFVIKAHAADAIETYLWRKSTRSPFSKRIISGAETYVNPVRRVQAVTWEALGDDAVLFWVGRWPLITYKTGSITNSGSGDEQNNSGTSGGGYSKDITILYIRGTIDIKALMSKCLIEYNDLKQGVTNKKNDATKRKRFQVITFMGTNGTASQGDSDPSAKAASDTGSLNEHVLMRLTIGHYRLMDWNPNDLIATKIDDEPFTTYAYPPEIQEFINEMERWHKSEDWFTSRKVPWRKGALLYGLPGTGKTTFAKATAQYLDLPLYRFDLGTMSNQELVKHWNSMQSRSPAIALIEDIDNVFHGRENIHAKHGAQGKSYLTFDCLLNVIAGVNSVDGIITMVTTNDVTKLDDALGRPNAEGKSTRPGRLDRMIEFVDMKEPQRRQVAKRVLDDWPEEVDIAVEEGAGMVAAQFEDHICQKAIKLFWESEDQQLKNGDIPVKTRSYSNDSADMEMEISNEEPIPLNRS